MSTSVYKPIRVIPRTPDRLMLQTSVKKVRKELFGPVDHTATQLFLDEELSKMRKRESEKWNFNFLTEEVLDPQGLFDWRPATPSKCIRPIKVKRISEFDDFDNEGMYPDPVEFESVPVEIVKPKAIKIEHVNNNHSRKIEMHQTQSLITDFMPIKKKSTESSKKKSNWNLDRPACKRPRTSELPS